jgi:hypothetical protein
MLADNDREVLVYKRWNEVGGLVVVMANLRDHPAGEVAVGGCGLEDGDYHEHVFDYDTRVDGGTLKTTLGPSEVKVFVKT